jgi:hypothetical protein
MFYFVSNLGIQAMATQQQTSEHTLTQSNLPNGVKAIHHLICLALKEPDSVNSQTCASIIAALELLDNIHSEHE